MRANKLSQKDMIQISLFSVIIAIVSQLSIPLPFGIPLTLQTLIIPLTGVILGAKKGTIATIIYILIGAVGVPVFANFSGGFGVILGPTGGFILTFPILAFICGSYYNAPRWIFAITLLIGYIINSAVGLLCFSLYMKASLEASFIYCILPFIPTELIKLTVLFFFSKPIRSLVVKSGVSL